MERREGSKEQRAKSEHKHEKSSLREGSLLRGESFFENG
jgi:hypothetical protein